MTQTSGDRKTVASAAVCGFGFNDEDFAVVRRPVNGSSHYRINVITLFDTLKFLRTFNWQAVF